MLVAVVGRWLETTTLLEDATEDERTTLLEAVEDE
jgi:hypothetical protein